MSRNDINELVQETVRKYRTKNPFELAESLGIDLDFADLGGLKGFYIVYGKGRYIVINENLDERLAKLADVAGLETAGMNDAQKANLFIEKIKELNKTMNIPDKLDILEKDIPTIAKRALKEGNPLYPVPKIMNAADCEAVIKRLMK